MEITFFDRLRPIIAPIAVAIAVFLGGFIAKATGIVDFSTTAFTDRLAEIIVFVVLAVGSTFLNKKFNPRNAASTEEAKRGLVENRYMRRTGMVMPHSVPPPDPDYGRHGPGTEGPLHKSRKL